MRELQDYLRDHPADSAIETRARSPEDEQPLDPVSTQVRRILKHQLTCVGRGLKAIQQATADAAMKNTTTSLLSEIGAVIKELDDETVLPHELFDKIGPPAVRVESAVKNA
jgi:hypothetical protein